MLYETIPFPIFRHIMDYMGRLPRWDEEVYCVIQKHLKNKYCKICGEYIDIEKQFDRDEYPKHLHNKYEKHKFIVNKTKNYYFSNYTWDDLCYEMFIPVLYSRPIACRILFFTRHLHHNYHMIIKNDDVFIIRQNFIRKICDPFYNQEFSIINPNHFFLNEMITGFNKSNICDIIMNLMNNEIMMIHTNKLMNKLYYRFYNIFLGQDRMKDFFSLVNMEIIFRYNLKSDYNIAKKILTNHYDIVLDLIPEDTLNYFIKHQQKWFLKYIQIYPDVLKYITII